MRTVGTALVEGLRARGVEVVFGIPGVHTIELYRGLPGSGIRHVTPRHEGGAGFMADGYARATGRPGVCFVITGPGLTNVATAMGQARAESVPMLVVSSTLARASLGQGRGALHEMPDQAAFARTLALDSQTLLDPGALDRTLDRAWAAALGAEGRAGPAHLEVPLDVLAMPAAAPREGTVPWAPGEAPPDGSIPEAARRLGAAGRPAILAGGGARDADLRALAEALDAPVVQTVNARGVLAGHPLSVPASPSLAPVRALLADADAVLAIGTEMGPTDYDMYVDGGFPALRNLLRVDRDGARALRDAGATGIAADARAFVDALLPALPPRRDRGGAARARDAVQAARRALSPEHARCLRVLEAVRDALPGSPIVGDSTEPVYAGNLLFEPTGRWANSATGFGTLGWAVPAALGWALGAPGLPVVALVGDGGLQFTAGELGALRDEGAPVIVLVWNNGGYREIETAMRDAGAEPVGVTPTPPDFVALAGAYGIPAARAESEGALPRLLREAAARGGPALIELPAAVVHGR